MDTAPSGAMMIVCATIAPLVAISCTATGVPIFNALCRISASNLPRSLRFSRSWGLQKQQRHAMARLTTAQAHAVPIPAPMTPYFGIKMALNTTSSTHIAALRMLGVSMSPLHCRQDEENELS